MTSYSQCAQDLWVVEVLQGKRNGLFLDFGCHLPFELNNTWLLESQFGWTGLSIDRDDRVAHEWVRSERKSPFVCADIHLIDIPKFCSALSPQFDYLSMDVDEYQVELCEKFPWDKVRFMCLTVEHDSYRFGNESRDKIRTILTAAGYEIAKKDLTMQHGPFEDWWIDGKKGVLV